MITADEALRLAAARIQELESKLGSSVQIEHNSTDSWPWRVSYRDEHAVGQTLGHALARLGEHLIRKVPLPEPPK